ncbi:hypothetical protein BH09PSE1_BH09PSE1_07780 [soil metagenome]
MKVAIVLGPGADFSVDEPNPIETVVRTLARHSRDRDDLLILCDEGAADRGDLNTLTVPYRNEDRGRRTRHVIEALKAFGPDFIECQQHGPTSARIARAFPHIPSSLYRHNLAVGAKGPIDRLRFRHRYSPFDAHVFVGEFLRADFAAKFPEFAARGYAMPNPIDASLWPGDPHDKDRLIAFAGRATPEKGLDLLCDALAVVLARRPDWRTALVLNDWHVHEDWSRAQLDKLSAFGGRVSVKTSQPLAVVQETLKRAAIVAVPSVFQDPFPLAVLEAHAVGAAVVSSGRGGLKQASGGHAVIVDPLTGQNLAEAIDGLIAEPSRRLALAVAGQDYVVTEYDARRRATALDDLRAQLVAARRVAGTPATV